MNFKKIFIFLFICSYTSNFAQFGNTVKSNSLFFEIGGLGGFYSFNYERNIIINERHGINLSLGFSPQGIYGFLEQAYMPHLPIQIKTYYQINERNFVDFGLGISPFNGNGVYGFGSDDYNIVTFAQVGYKRFSKSKKYYLGLAFTPAFYDTYEFRFVPWGALRIGYNFEKTGKSQKRNDDEKTNKTNNISGIFGPLNPKIRLQYEKSCGEKSSVGITLTSYIYHLQYAGSKADFFGRYYFTHPDQMEGLFLQAKIGLGYLYSGLNVKYAEVPTFGFSFGGGIAGGYKFFIGKHITLESILGIHYYTPPFVKDISPSQVEKEKEWWYSMTGFPLDLQFKIGWQY